MRPEARRRTRAPGQRVRTFAHRRGTGEKVGTSGWPRPAPCSDVQVPGGRRTPGQIMGPNPGPRPAAPRAVNRWYTCDITADRAVTISKVFDYAERRDPGHQRTWVALADGDIHQLGLIQAEARARRHSGHHRDRLHPRAGIPVKGSLVLSPAPRPRHGRPGRRSGPGHPARPRPGDVTQIPQLAAGHPPRRPRARQDHPRDAALPPGQAALHGLPRCPGERMADRHRRHRRRCRHLVQDRMAITGARWGLPGARAFLWLRAIEASGDPAPTGPGTSSKNTTATTAAATTTASPGSLSHQKSRTVTTTTLTARDQARPAGAAPRSAALAAGARRPGPAYRAESSLVVGLPADWPILPVTDEASSVTQSIGKTAEYGTTAARRTIGLLARR